MPTTVSDYILGVAPASRIWIFGALALTLIASAGCTKSKATLWNGIPVCGAKSLVDGILFVDARGEIRQFDHRNSIDHFYLSPGDEVKIVADFDAHTDVLDRINIVSVHRAAETIERFARELGVPDTERLSRVRNNTPNPQMQRSGAHTMTWRTKTGSITIVTDNDGSRNALQYDPYCSIGNRIGLGISTEIGDFILFYIKLTAVN